MAKKSESLFAPALSLFLITLISGLLLGAVYVVTKEPIELREQQEKEEAYQAVCADAVGFEVTDDITALLGEQEAIFETAGLTKVEITECMATLDSDGDVIGYVMTSVSHAGYGGDIEIALGMNTEGSVTGLEFLSIEETAGLGMNAQKSEFKDQYLGRLVEAFTVVKGESSSDEEIVAVSSATITSRAVTSAVNAGLAFVWALQEVSE
ncbi:MAG: FMN-binding protein [Lachnospiraceae bacterium]|nr:FMN-binding protein [Lachnospiraceae bacterium]